MTLEEYTIDASFLEKYKIPLTAQELLWGMYRDFIRPKAVIDYVVTLLPNLHEGSPLYEIALLNNKEERYRVREILEKTLKIQSKDCHHAYIEVELAEKWLYLLLKCLYERRLNFDDPWGIIETIYANLDYPQEIEQLVRYMPMNNFNDEDQLKLSPMERMTNRWASFLMKKDKKFIPV